MEDKDYTVRVNIRMSKELKSWYEQKAKREGMAYSAFMVMALREYMKQEVMGTSLSEAIALNKLKEID